MASNASRRAATLKNPRLLKHLGTNGNIRRRDGLSARGASAHDLVDRPPPLGTRVLARRALRSRHAGAERGSSSRSRRLPGRRVGRHLPRATHRADGGRAPSGRGHKPHRRAVGKAALSISVTGVAVPFICGFALGQLMPQSLLPRPDQRLLTSLFLGTALSISSIKIVAAVVREMGFTRRNLGQIIVASAICEDSIGWVIIAIIFGLAQAGTIDLMSVAKSVLGTAVFLIASLTFGRRIVYFLIRWTNDNFASDFPVITMILVIMGVMALTTHFIGVHTVLGAFVAGVLVGESPILSKHIDEQLRGLILAFFMPVFFGIAGLSADLTILKDATLLLMTLAQIAIASFGKFAGAFIGGKFGGLTRREAFALACGMNARGSTEVIVATIGLSMGALTQDLFTMIVTMAVATTMAMPPMLRWALARVPLSRAEKQRLEREEYEARGFVSNLERLLLAVDRSPNGKFAGRLAGLLAGTGGIAITILPLSDGDKAGGEQEKKEPR